MVGPQTVMQFRRFGVRFAKGAAGIAAVALAVSVCVPDAFPSFRAAISLSGISSFKHEATRFLAAAREADEIDAPALRGRLVPFDMRRRDVDDETYFLLDARIRAGHPDDVGTVALLAWSVDHDGGPGGTAVGLGDVRLLDLAAGTIVGRTTIVGEDASYPRAEVARYLNGLPRRTAAPR